MGDAQEDGVLALDLIETLGNAHFDLKDVEAAVDFINTAERGVPQSLLDTKWTAVARIFKCPY